MAVRTRRCAFLDPTVPDVEVTLPGNVRRVGGRSSFGVLMLGNLEVELNDSHEDFLPEYFATSGARPEDEVTLRSGRTVRLGRVGGRNGTGHCFGVEVGNRSLLGTVPPTISVRRLTAWLSDLHIGATKAGLTVRPTRTQWSSKRPPHVVLVLVMTSGQRVLLDVRPAYRKGRTATAGLRVAGGHLNRVSPPGQAEYLTLDAPDHVAYVLPSTTEHLDEVAELGADLSLRAVRT